MSKGSFRNLVLMTFSSESLCGPILGGVLDLVMTHMSISFHWEERDFYLWIMLGFSQWFHRGSAVTTHDHTGTSPIREGNMLGLSMIPSGECCHNSRSHWHISHQGNMLGLSMIPSGECCHNSAHLPSGEHAGVVNDSIRGVLSQLTITLAGLHQGIMLGLSMIPSGECCHNSRSHWHVSHQGNMLGAHLPSGEHAGVVNDSIRGVLSQLTITLAGLHQGIMLGLSMIPSGECWTSVTTHDHTGTSPIRGSCWGSVKTRSPAWFHRGSAGLQSQLTPALTTPSGLHLQLHQGSVPANCNVLIGSLCTTIVEILIFPMCPWLMRLH
jgi:preprotein translocase subunit SecG